MLNAFLANAQSSFSIAPTDTVFAAKPATSVVFYNYIQFDNLSGDSLFMRWEIIERNIDNATVGLGEWGDWVTAYQDPTSSSFEANNILTSDFILVPESGAFDKLVYQLLPNDDIGTLVTTFKIYPIDNPTDSVNITFHYESLEEPSSAADLAVSNAKLKLFPIPTSGELNLQNLSDYAIRAKVLNELGQEQEAITIHAKQTFELPCADWQPGIYFVRYTIGNTLYTKKILVQ